MNIWGLGRLDTKYTMNIWGLGRLDTKYTMTFRNPGICKFISLHNIFLNKYFKLNDNKNSFMGFIADLQKLQQLNYPISPLPILFRSVDRLVNDH